MNSHDGLDPLQLPKIPVLRRLLFRYFPIGNLKTHHRARVKDNAQALETH